jgi:hypothetical protein
MLGWGHFQLALLAQYVMRLARGVNLGIGVLDRVKPDAVMPKNVIRPSDERQDETAGSQKFAD